jgi:predicted kinase
MEKSNIIKVRRFFEIALVTKAFLIASPKPIALLPIGPQGCGTSTLAADLARRFYDFEIISQDEIRKKMFSELYPELREAGQEKMYEVLRPKEPEIRSKAIEMLKNSVKPVVYIDRMNLTATSRADFILPDRFNVAIFFRLPLEEILNRHKSRPLKALAIPDYIVISCFRRVEFPKQEEFDAIVIIEQIRRRRREGIAKSEDKDSVK